MVDLFIVERDVEWHRRCTKVAEDDLSLVRGWKVVLATLLLM